MQRRSQYRTARENPPRIALLSSCLVAASLATSACGARSALRESEIDASALGPEDAAMSAPLVCRRRSADHFVRVQQTIDSWGSTGPQLTIWNTCKATISDATHDLARVVETRTCARLRELLECEDVLDRIRDCRSYDYNEFAEVVFDSGRTIHGDTACSDVGYHTLDRELQALLADLRRTWTD